MALESHLMKDAKIMNRVFNFENHDLFSVTVLRIFHVSHMTITFSVAGSEWRFLLEVHVD